MFFVLAKQDVYFLPAVVTLIIILLFLTFSLITKILPSKSGYIELGKMGMGILSGIYLAIILFCLVLTICRVRSINYFINNGINVTASIQKITKKNHKKIYFSYIYDIEDKNYSGDARVNKKEDFPYLITGKNIYILVDPENFDKSLFVRIQKP
jgi:hypothetical protein